MTSNATAKSALFELPIPSTELTRDAFICGDELRFQFVREGLPIRAALRFDKIAAIQARSERSCTASQIEAAYDVLVEIHDSEWLAQIKADTQELWRDKWEMHHYMIYLDSAGCFEFIAASWTSYEESGSW
jgi:hypothetical protein